VEKVCGAVETTISPYKTAVKVPNNPVMIDGVNVVAGADDDEGDTGIAVVVVVAAAATVAASSREDRIHCPIAPSWVRCLKIPQWYSESCRHGCCY